MAYSFHAPSPIHPVLVFPSYLESETCRQWFVGKDMSDYCIYSFSITISVLNNKSYPVCDQAHIYVPCKARFLQDGDLLDVRFLSIFKDLPHSSMLRVILKYGVHHVVTMPCCSAENYFCHHVLRGEV